jgi:branched-subunit amino acid aminotransferase/4-amino-4-deoxychorismate lyase
MGEGASAARRDRRAACRAGVVTLVALAELGRGVVPPDTPLLHADDEGVLRGRSVFETTRVYNGVPFKLDAHLVRLAASAERLRLPAPPRDVLAALARDAIDAGGLPDATLRFLWTAGREGGGAPAGLALVSTLPSNLDAMRARGLRLAVIRWAPGALAGAKSTSYAENMAAQDEAVRAGADDALLVDPGGTVLEGPTSNVWFREGERLLTPSLALPLLAGVTRATLGELAPGLGYEIEEGVFELARVLGADEIFLSSSVREVMPVVAVDGAPIAPGRAATALQAALRTAAGYPDGYD